MLKRNEIGRRKRGRKEEIGEKEEEEEERSAGARRKAWSGWGGEG